MPPASLLSQPALDPREQILLLARRAFVDKGFDGASMQDLARAAGMSAGNFYRYFPSKSAIVEAFIALEMTRIDQQFALIHAAPDPLQAIHDQLTRRAANGCEPDSSLWAEIVAAAHRRPEIAAAVIRLESLVERHIVNLFAMMKGLAPDEAARRYATEARLILILVRGAEMEVALNPSSQKALKELVFRTISRVLEDILTDRSGTDPS